MSVTRYLQTLCIAYEAADFYTSYGQRMASQPMQLQAYMISCKPSVPDVTAATVRKFTSRFVDRFPFPDTDVNLNVAFETLAVSLEKKAFDAAEHAEAILMALACSTLSDNSVEGLDSEDAAIQSIFRVSATPVSLSTRHSADMFRHWQTTRIPVGICEKCCYCCHKLAELLKRRAGLDCVLPGQGTHSTAVLPCIPPAGLPTDVLVELRVILLRVLHGTIETVLDTIRSAQTSPTDSTSTEAPPLHKSGDFRARRFTLTPDNSPDISPQPEESVGGPEPESGSTEDFRL